ncbi:competence protein ComK [Cytobacillus sp. NCCP-133]|uniref:competence protein ComK n=1 Tax=Cytobacillus sp. NCCP-133 TaxID=766848 RepID=UPI00222ECC78|nr:competence protein ComK [Cytobacillus sp. NCCP-133]GLB61873.1 hypothetical protein NCCP133_40020 [Cytobacillus sp. NCCP-133]
MFSEKYYIINQHFMYMKGEYDPNGKLCTIVTELKKTILVDKAPLKILEDSIKCIGFDLRGAMATAKWIIGDTHMTPVMVNPIHRICVFPDKSAKNDETTWFNPNHIVRTRDFNRKTKIEFRNGQTLTVPSKLPAFNHKLQTAEQLRNITIEIGENPISFIIEPQIDQIRLSHSR